MNYDSMIHTLIWSGFAMIPFILFFSTIFSDAKFASDIGGFFYVIFSLGSFALLTKSDDWMYWIGCLFP